MSSDISIHVLVNMAAESLAPMVFDAHFNSCDCALFSV